jgi:hypothetical protein
MVSTDEWRKPGRFLRWRRLRYCTHCGEWIIRRRGIWLAAWPAAVCDRNSYHKPHKK